MPVLGQFMQERTCITTADSVSSRVQSCIGTSPSPCLKLQPLGSPLSHIVPEGVVLAAVRSCLLNPDPTQPEDHRPSGAEKPL